MRHETHFTKRPDLLTIPEVASFLHIGIAHMWRLARTGKIGSYKTGKRYLFDFQRHVVPYLRAGEIGTEGAAND
jgi:excisionase family DNA binding protein